MLLVWWILSECVTNLTDFFKKNSKKVSVIINYIVHVNLSDLIIITVSENIFDIFQLNDLIMILVRDFRVCGLLSYWKVLKNLWNEVVWFCEILSCRNDV